VQLFTHIYQLKLIPPTGSHLLLLATIFAKGANINHPFWPQNSNTDNRNAEANQLSVFINLINQCLSFK
ncbi:hypothetical protein, partial [Prevotella sp.]|uniref:hypothetical protein n=1 Tax=Prevotella sp. TaxID=59823 RepID=UPI0030787AC9